MRLLIFISIFLSLNTYSFSSLEEFFSSSSQMKKNLKLEWDKGFELNGPRNTKVALLELVNQGKFFCLYYRVPIKSDEEGELSLIKRASKESCFHSLKGEKLISKSLVATLFKIEVSAYRIRLYLGEAEAYGLKRSLLPRSYQIYSSFLELSKKGSIEFLEKDFSLSEKKVERDNGTYREGSAKICRSLKADCSVRFDQCRQCAGEVFEVLKRGCSKDEMYCGNNSCGSRGFPACRRFSTKAFFKGRSAVSCHELKEVAFCRKGLDPICDNQGVVVCL